MIFSTYKFIFLFLPITFVVYFLLGKLKQKSLSKIWLICCSLYFYAAGDPEFFPFFLLSIFFNYIFGTAIGSQENKVAKKVLITVGVLANVALLGYYKYTDFFLENINLLTGNRFELLHIALPIGISFFTFQLIAYLVDSYRGLTKNYNILDYLLFITFFPQLIVGPIVHHSDAVPQFEDERNSRINTRNLMIGLFTFGIGCAKKILLADPLTTEAQAFWAALNTAGLPSFWDAWYHSFEYTISYYFDLSGYADMAIGLGYMFNIVLPENFNSPYKARNFQEYWRRWHMTLSKFLSEYIFRSWYDKNKRLHGYYAATMVTFFVSGFWHGAGWTFIVWGIINGALVCVAAWMKRKGWKLPSLLAYPMTMIGVVACRVLFVSGSFSDALLMLRGMINFETIANVSVTNFELANIITLAIGTFICWCMPTTKCIREKFVALLDANKSRALWLMAGATALFMVSIMYMNKVAQFLYFQF